MTQEKFEFGNNIIKGIVHELDKAESYIKIVVFQLQNTEIIEKLIKKAKKGIKIKILMPPKESIFEKGTDKDYKKNMILKINELKKQGADIYECDWNIGDTGNTKSVPSIYYLLHLKFIVTDKAAIALSANMISNDEIDSFLVYEGDEKRIKEFNEKFKFLEDIYCEEKIVKKIKDKVNDEEFKNIFTPPEHIDKQVQKCKNHSVKRSILHYPLDLCPEIETIEEKTYLCPFESRARSLIKKIIEDAEKFVYIVSERFTDEDIHYFLMEKKRKTNIDIKIFSGFKSQDYSEKIKDLAKDLLALGICYNTYEKVHSKLIITDKLIALGSVNLNQMNLGHPKGSKGKYWRANTEIMTICKNKDIIQRAKSQFEGKYNSSINVLEKMINKQDEKIGKLLNKSLGLKGKHWKIKKVMAKKYIENEIKERKKFFEMMLEAEKLMKEKNLNRITVDLIKEAEKNLDGKNPQIKL